MVRALASNQCSSAVQIVGWVCCGFRFALVAFLRVLCIFLALQKPTSPNSNSTRIEDPHENQADVASFLNIAIHLFLKCICPARDPPFYRRNMVLASFSWRLIHVFSHFTPQVRNAACFKASMMNWRVNTRDWRPDTANWYKISITRKPTGKTGEHFSQDLYRGCGLNLTDRKKQKTFIPFPGFMQALLPAAVKEWSPRSSPELFGEERTPDSKERRKSILGFMPFWNVFIITV